MIRQMPRFDAGRGEAQLAPGSSRCAPSKARGAILLKRSLYTRARRSVRSGSDQTQVWKASFDLLQLLLGSLGVDDIEDAPFGCAVPDRVEDLGMRLLRASASNSPACRRSVPQSDVPAAIQAS